VAVISCTFSNFQEIYKEHSGNLFLFLVNIWNICFVSNIKGSSEFVEFVDKTTLFFID
jgi:hypothetical protein